VVESIIDPYNLIAKIKEQIGNEAESQTLVQNNFDFFLNQIEAPTESAN
jgi:hypothetical protein